MKVSDAVMLLLARAMRGSSIVVALGRSSPGVLTEVVLKKSSSLVLTAGVKPLGVCADAILAKAATSNEEEIYMIKMYVLYEAELYVGIGTGECMVDQRSR